MDRTAPPSSPPAPPPRERALRDRVRAVLGPLALLAAGLASAATSTARQVRQYPGWHPEAGAEFEAGCAAASVWVSKSGKQGLGITARLEARRTGCQVSLLEICLRVAGGTVTPLDPPAPLAVEPGRPAHVYLAFPFDGDALWNSGDRRAVLRLTLASGGASTPLEIAFLEVLEVQPDPAGGAP